MENRKADQKFIQKFNSTFRAGFLPKYMKGRVEVEPVGRHFHYEEQPYVEGQEADVVFKRINDELLRSHSPQDL